MSLDTHEIEARSTHDVSAYVPSSLDELDKRCRMYRRYNAILEALHSDLGGAEHLTEARKQLADKAAFLAVRLECMEAQSIAGHDIDLQLFGTLSDRLRRLLAEIGLDRVARHIADLGAYLAEKSRQRVPGGDTL